MPPKKAAKTGKKKAAAGGEKPVTLEELQTEINRLMEDLQKEKENRNFFQLERDKINTLWEVAKTDLEDRKAELRNKDREMEELEEKHQVEIKVYKQKVKHLLYEHQNSTTLLKSEAETALKLQLDEFRGLEGDMKRDKRALKLELKEIELSHEDIIKNLKQEHDKNVTKLRQEFDRQLQQTISKYDHRMNQLRLDMDLRRKNEIHEIEERKNQHIKQLMEKHEKAFGDIKSYYNDITLNNLELIKSLKEQVEEMKKKETSMEKLMYEITQENKRLSEPLKQALREVEELRGKLQNYNKDKLVLTNSKARVKSLESQLKQLEWEKEVLEQRFEKVEKERDDLYEQFVSSIYEVQQKAGFKNLLLEKKLNTISESLEKKEAQLQETIAAANLDPAALGQVTSKLEDILDTKNAQLKEMQFEVAKVSKQHNDMLRTFQAKLQEYGIPPEELGFQPLKTQTTTAPAGLVSQ
eukprot:GCRY01001757.1.p1 GENE.GCRY01001757.1~~GCRY01001757.1.p1  ORF type:complete len:468 (-),score=123.98 GCRY01001757.1:514-1917(-)